MEPAISLINLIKEVQMQIGMKAIGALASIACMISIGGCGRQSNSSSAQDSTALKSIDAKPAKGEITIWAMGAEGEAMPKFIKQFEQENPDVKIKLTTLPWSSYREKFRTAVASGTGPDISMAGNADLAAFSDAFSPAPSNFDLTDIPMSLRKISNVNGRQIAIPFYADPRVMFYRTDIAQQAGWDRAPKTWDELKQMASDVRKVDGVSSGIYIGPAGTDSFQNYLFWAYSNGASIMNADHSKYTFDTPEFKGALEYTTDLFKTGIADPNVSIEAGADLQQFVAGKIPIMFTSPYALTELKKLGGEDFNNRYATAVLPKSKSSTSFVGGANVAVWKNSKNKQAAWKYIQWFLKPETQVEFYKASSDLPASTKATQDKALSDNPKMVPFLEQVKDVKSGPYASTWPQLLAYADKEFEHICKGTITVDAGLADIQKQADSLGAGK